MKKNPFKIIWLLYAFLSLGIGAVGVILPVLPTTPFLLLAPFCFAKGILSMPRPILPLQRAVGGEGDMIASRTEGERALVRIHDEYCESEPEAWLPRLNKIVTVAYRRRTAEGR